MGSWAKVDVVETSPEMVRLSSKYVSSVAGLPVATSTYVGPTPMTLVVV